MADSNSVIKFKLQYSPLFSESISLPLSENLHSSISDFVKGLGFELKNIFWKNPKGNLIALEGNMKRMLKVNRDSEIIKLYGIADSDSEDSDDSDASDSSDLVRIKCSRKRRHSGPRFHWERHHRRAPFDFMIAHRTPRYHHREMQQFPPTCPFEQRFMNHRPPIHHRPPMHHRPPIHHRKPFRRMF